MHCGPVTADALAYWFGLADAEVEKALLRLEAAGSILRGNFTGSAKGNEPHTAEWCDRRLLARIHRLTVATLRKQIEPVTAAQFMRWLLRWQHVAPQSQLSGERGLLEAVRQLQGFEIPANAWEKQILALRVEQLRSGRARSTLLDWRRRLGPAFAASCHAGRFGRRPAPRGSHQRCADHVLRARRFGLDAAASDAKKNRVMNAC